jgi:hypothetical protein
LKLQIESLSTIYRKILIILTDSSEESVEPGFFRSKKITIISHHKDKNLVPENAALIAYCLSLVDSEGKKKKHIHIANSMFGYRLVQIYGQQLKDNCYVTSNIFCNDEDIKGFPVGYLNLYDQIGRHFHSIFTDNKHTKKQLINAFKLDEKNITVLDIPTAALNIIPSYLQSNYDDHEKNFIWASRLDRQKAPMDTLLAAKSFPDIKFRIYGDSVLEGQDYKSIFLNSVAQLKNISYQGPFRSIEELNFNDSIFLYTSHWDGLPNIILEVGSIGVPILSYPLPGLISQFSNEEIIFTDEISPESIVQKISEILNGKYDIRSYGEKIRKKILNLHKVDVFHNKFIEKIGEQHE